MRGRSTAIAIAIVAALAGSLLAACGTEGASDGAGVMSRPVLAADEASGSSDGSLASTGSEASDDTIFRSDVTVVEEPQSANSDGSVRSVARLVSKNGVLAVEVTVDGQPSGTAYVEHRLGGRVRGRSTFVPGAVSAIRIWEDDLVSGAVQIQTVFLDEDFEVISEGDVQVLEIPQEFGGLVGEE